MTLHGVVCPFPFAAAGCCFAVVAVSPRMRVDVHLPRLRALGLVEYLESRRNAPHPVAGMSVNPFPFGPGKRPEAIAALHTLTQSLPSLHGLSPDLPATGDGTLSGVPVAPGILFGARGAPPPFEDDPDLTSTLRQGDTTLSGLRQRLALRKKMADGRAASAIEPGATLTLVPAATPNSALLSSKGKEVRFAMRDRSRFFALLACAFINSAQCLVDECLWSFGANLVCQACLLTFFALGAVYVHADLEYTLTLSTR